MEWLSEVYVRERQRVAILQYQHEWKERGGKEAVANGGGEVEAEDIVRRQRVSLGRRANEGPEWRQVGSSTRRSSLMLRFGQKDRTWQRPTEIGGEGVQSGRHEPSPSRAPSLSTSGL